MPSARRVRLVILVALAVTITTLFFTSQWRATTEHDSRTIQDFFGKTKSALESSERGSGGAQVVLTPVKDKDGDGSVDKDDELLAEEMAARVRAAEKKAKELANAKALKPDAPSEIVGVGSSAGGQKKPKGKGKASEDDQYEETPEEHELEMILNEIFKKSPVIIFSKTFCPYSKRAKALLLEKYSIEPAPFVVELDQHPKGPKLQSKLAEMTGRKTVPNVMVNGKSIGGSDDIAELDSRGTLIDKIKSMGGKRVSMKERFVDNSNKRESS